MGQSASNARNRIRTEEEAMLHSPDSFSSAEDNPAKEKMIPPYAVGSSHSFACAAVSTHDLAPKVRNSSVKIAFFKLEECRASDAKFHNQICPPEYPTALCDDEEATEDFYASDDLANYPSYWGLYGAADVLNLERNEGKHFDGRLNLLFLENGLRHFIKTIALVPDTASPEIHATLAAKAMWDNARVIVVLLLLTDDTHWPRLNAEAAVHFWYSSMIPQAIYDYVAHIVTAAYLSVTEEVQHRADLADEEDMLDIRIPRGKSTLVLSMRVYTWVNLTKCFNRCDPAPWDASWRQRMRDVHQNAEPVQRAFLRMKLSRAAGCSRWSNDGIMLPFGQHRESYGVPNPLFYNNLPYPKGAGREPLAEWDMADILAREQSDPGEAPDDLYGKMFYLVRTECEMFHARWAKLKTTIRILEEDLDGTISSCAKSGELFDRIETGTLIDEATIPVFLGLPRLLQHKDINPNATMLTMTRESVTTPSAPNAEDFRAEARQLFVPSGTVLDKYAPPVKGVRMAREFLRRQLGLLAWRDWDKISARHLNDARHNLAMGLMPGVPPAGVKPISFLAKSLGLELKSSNTIVLPWPNRIVWKWKADVSEPLFQFWLGWGDNKADRWLEWRRIGDSHYSLDDLCQLLRALEEAPGLSKMTELANDYFTSFTVSPPTDASGKQVDGKVQDGVAVNAGIDRFGDCDGDDDSDGVADDGDGDNPAKKRKKNKKKNKKKGVEETCLVPNGSHVAVPQEEEYASGGLLFSVSRGPKAPLDGPYARTLRLPVTSDPDPRVTTRWTRQGCIRCFPYIGNGALRNVCDLWLALLPGLIRAFSATGGSPRVPQAGSASAASLKKRHDIANEKPPMVKKEPFRNSHKSLPTATLVPGALGLGKLVFNSTKFMADAHAAMYPSTQASMSLALRDMCTPSNGRTRMDMRAVRNYAALLWSSTKAFFVQQCKIPGGWADECCNWGPKVVVVLPFKALSGAVMEYNAQYQPQAQSTEDRRWDDNAPRNLHKRPNYRPTPLKWYYVLVQIIALMAAMGVVLWARQDMPDSDNSAKFENRRWVEESSVAVRTAPGSNLPSATAAIAPEVTAVQELEDLRRDAAPAQHVPRQDESAVDEPTAANILMATSTFVQEGSFVVTVPGTTGKFTTSIPNVQYSTYYEIQTHVVDGETITQTFTSTFTTKTQIPSVVSEPGKVTQSYVIGTSTEYTMVPGTGTDTEMYSSPIAVEYTKTMEVTLSGGVYTTMVDVVTEYESTFEDVSTLAGTVETYAASGPPVTSAVATSYKVSVGETTAKPTTYITYGKFTITSTFTDPDPPTNKAPPKETPKPQPTVIDVVSVKSDQTIKKIQTIAPVTIVTEVDNVQTLVWSQAPETVVTQLDPYVTNVEVVTYDINGSPTTIQVASTISGGLATIIRTPGPTTFVSTKGAKLVTLTSSAGESTLISTIDGTTQTFSSTVLPTGTETATGEAGEDGRVHTKVITVDLQENSYFVGKFLPALISVIIAIPLRIIDFNAQLYQPFYAMNLPQGALGSNSMTLHYSGWTGFIKPFQMMSEGHPITFITMLIVWCSALMTPLATEAIGIKVHGRCGVKIAGSDCHGALGVSSTPTHALIALIGFTIVLLCALLFFLRNFDTGLYANPWSIAGTASLAANREIRPQHSTEKKIIKEMADKKYGFGHFETYDGQTEYGIVLYDDAGQALRRDVEPQSEASSIDLAAAKHTEKRSNPFIPLHWAWRGTFMFFLVGLMALILYYHINKDKTGSFFTFMNGQTFGIRFLFATLGVGLSFGWTALFISVAMINPYQIMSLKSQNASDSILLTRPTNGFSGLYSSLKHGHLFPAVVALMTIISDFIPIILVNIPYTVTQTMASHIICARLAVGIMFVMVLTLIWSFFIRWPDMPVDPRSVAGTMYYVSESAMTEHFSGLARLDRKEREARVKEMGGRYYFGDMLTKEGERRTAVEREDGTDADAYDPVAREAEKREMTTLFERINIHALEARASHLRRGIPCSIPLLQYDRATRSSVMGGMNYHIEVHFDDGITWIARIRRCNATSPPPALRDYIIQSEAATLMFLERNWSFIPESKSLRWSVATPPQKRKVMDQLADVFVELHRYPFDRLGSLDKPGEAHVGAFAREALTDIAGPDMRPLGPFCSVEDYHRSSLKLILDLIIREEMYSEQAVDAYLIHRYLVDLIPRVLSPVHGDDKYYLKHADDKGDHILVDEDFNITGIIDWEWAHTASAAHAFNSPIGFLPVGDFYDGKNDLGDDEAVFAGLLEQKGREDLARFVWEGRLQHRFSFCCGYDLQDWDGFVGLFKGLRNAVGVDGDLGWDEWKVEALRRYEDDSRLQLLLTRHQTTLE
ncbi:hypothetical protein G7046_g4727 [Stylonectria norvegica]|nr:hypothetical protein G7046_g4727 [Stylonectria norvegica]